MTTPQPAWVSAAALQGTLASSAQRFEACTCTSDYDKRLALATAVAKQHIALGLAPQHTRALRVTPSYGSQQQDTNAAAVKQTQHMAQLLEQQAHQIQAQQVALQKMLQDQSTAAGSSRSQLKKQPASAPEHAAAISDSVAGVSTGCETVRPLRPIPVTQPNTGPAVSQPIHACQTPAAAPILNANASGTGQQSATSDGVSPTGHAAPRKCSQAATLQTQPVSASAPSSCISISGDQAPMSCSAIDSQTVSVTAQPELYTAMYAAVTAVVQQAGLPGSNTVTSQGVQAKPDCNAQQLDTSEKALATTSLASASHVHQNHQESVPRHSTAQAESTTSRAQCSAADVVEGTMGNVAKGQGNAAEGTKANAAEGGKGNVAQGTECKSPGQLQAWQHQIQQAMDMLQSSLQDSSKGAGIPPPVSPSQLHNGSLPESGTHRVNQQHPSDQGQAWQRAKGAEQAANDQCGHHGSVGETHWLQSNQYSCSSMRHGPVPQQVGRPGDDQQQHQCGHPTWPSQAESPSQHEQQEKRRQVGAQRRLYKHGPVIPKSAVGMRPARRRQRPEWDDKLTHAQSQAEVEVAFSPRPTAKELLQEALARMRTVSSPRPQHAKRQRRGVAPCHDQQHSTAPRQLQSAAGDEEPQLQHACDPQRQYSGHSCAIHAVAARPSQKADSDQPARNHQPSVMQAAAKQLLVKQHAFGGKPRWVDKDSIRMKECQQGTQSAQLEQVDTESGDGGMPDFDDAGKAKAWQQLTNLQQRMMGLIAAVEGQLRLSDSPQLLTLNTDPHSSLSDSPQPAQQSTADKSSKAWPAAVDGNRHATTQSQQDQPSMGDAERAQALDAEKGMSSPLCSTEHDEPQLAGQAAAAEQQLGQPNGGSGAQDAAVGKASAAAEQQQQGDSQVLVLGKQPGAAQAPVETKGEKHTPAAGALSDTDVHRILAHRRAYLKQQRAFDRAYVGNEHAFDPTQVVESIADMLLDDVLQQSAADLGAACDSLAEEVFESEFVVQSAALRKISGQAV